jgi:mono/diheme cytochrome c family protein
MSSLRAPLALTGLAALLLTGCAADVEFTETLELGDQVVTADTLNDGHEAYTLYCMACHGHDGTGNGPAAPGYRPPPRDFTQATFKFGWVIDGLPHDADFDRILSMGLHGTPMLDWDIPPRDQYAIIQYIKTFALEDWAYPDALGEQIVSTPDPWAGKEQEALVRGSAVYHGYATCQQCHPAYVSRDEVVAAADEFGKTPALRDNIFFGESKESGYRVNDIPVRIMPPDFTFNPLRAGIGLDDLYKTIGSGIPGTAMPAWKGSIDESDLWALTHYVKYLADMRDTAAAAELRSRLKGGAHSAM